MQSATTRVILLTRMNARDDILICKTRDEFRLQPLGGGDPQPDDDLHTPVIPGLYLLDLALQYSIPAPSPTANGLRTSFSGPLGITDGGYGAITFIGIPQRNEANTGLLTPRDLGSANSSIGDVHYLNQSGWFGCRAPGDLVLNWTSSLPGGAGINLLRGSTIHLVRALNDED